MKGSNTRHYKPDSGSKLYRRSLYTFWKRTAPHPSMEILNAPSREVSCVRREQTNTPLQAFVVMNDPQFVESSRQLAAHALLNCKEKPTILQFIAARLLNRELTTREIEIVNQTLDFSYAKFKAAPRQSHSAHLSRRIQSTSRTRPSSTCGLDTHRQPNPQYG